MFSGPTDSSVNGVEWQYSITQGAAWKKSPAGAQIISIESWRWNVEWAQSH